MGLGSDEGKGGGGLGCPQAQVFVTAHIEITHTLWEITGISYGNKSRPDAHSNQMGHTLPIRDSWPLNLNGKDDLALLLSL